MNYSKYKQYKPSNVDWLGDIPAHWNFVKLKYVITLQKGKNPQHFSEDKKYLPYLTMDYLRGKTDEPIYAVPQSNLIEAQDKDLLILWDGANAGEIIRAKQGYVSSTMAVINIKNPLLNKEYLFFYLKWLEKILKKFAGGTTIPHLDTAILLNQKYALPPLTEQIAIAAYLDRKLADIDTFTAKKQRLITLLQEQKAAVIHKAVTKGLNEDKDAGCNFRASGVDWIGDIPEHWKMWKLSRAVKKIGSGTTPSSDHKDYYENGTINWLNTGDFNDGLLFECNKKITSKALNEYSALKLYPKGTLSIAMYGATIGKTCIIQFEAATNQACCNLIQGDIISNAFLMYWFISNRPHIVNLGYGGGQPNISQDVIRALKIPVPPLTEQIAIVSHIEAESARIDKAISLIERELTLVQEYRTALIAEAVTGKIKCPDVEQGQSIPS